MISSSKTSFLTALLLASAAQTPLSAEETKYTRYVPTSLESIVGDLPINQIAMDKNGNTWVASQSGLFVVDYEGNGLGQRAYPHLDNVVAADIVSVTQGAAGKVIGLSRTGEAIATNRSGKRLGQISLGSPGFGKAKALFRSTSNLYAIFEYGVVVLPDPEDLDFHTKHPDSSEIHFDKKLNGAITSKGLGICVSDRSSIYCGSSIVEQRPIFEAPGDLEISLIGHSTRKNSVLVLYTNGYLSVVDIDESVTGFSAPINSLEDLEVRSVYQLDSVIMICTDRGLYSLNPEDSSIQAIPMGKHNRFLGIHASTNGTWVAAESGVALLQSTDIFSWPVESYNSPIEVLSFGADDLENVYVGTYDGLYFLRRGSNTPIALRFQSGVELIDKRITAVEFYNGVVYVGSFSSGLTALDLSEDRGSVTSSTILLNDLGITTLRATNRGLIIGTDRVGLKLLQKGRIVDIPLTPRWVSFKTPITSLSGSPSDDYIIATTEDEVVLLCWEHDLKVCGSQSPSSIDKEVTLLSAKTSSTGAIWVSSLNDGLFKTSIEQMQHQSTLHSYTLPSFLGATKYDLLSTKEGLWLTTNRGIYFFSEQNNTLINYNYYDGLLNEDFNHGASLLTESGYLYAGGKNGVDRLNINKVKKTSQRANIWLTNIIISGLHHNARLHSRPYPLIELKHHDRDLTFLFSLNDYRDVSKNHYQHKLEGFDTAWRSAGNTNSVNYSKLPPGDYVFRARGENASGTRSEDEIAISVRVLGPLWLSWWALLSYALLTVMLLWVARRVHEQRVASRLRLEIAEDTAAAYQLLEDQYQELQDVVEQSTRFRGAAADNVLALAKLSTDPMLVPEPTPSATTEHSIVGARLETLRLVQELAVRASTGDKCDLNAALEAIHKQLISEHPEIAPAILLNDVTREPVALSRASYIGLILNEALRFTLLERNYEPGEDPIVEVRMNPPELKESSQALYTIYLRDSAVPHTHTGSFEQALPLSHHFVESTGGELSQTYDGGNVVNIVLRFEASDQ
jgi:hypothetical protein